MEDFLLSRLMHLALCMSFNHMINGKQNKTLGT